MNRLRKTVKLFWINFVIPKWNQIRQSTIKYLSFLKKKILPTCLRFQSFLKKIYIQSKLPILLEPFIKYISTYATKFKYKIVKLFHPIYDFFKILLSGIRAKLALFTGSLIAVTILLLSGITLQQQTAILTESYEKQAAISQKFVSNLVTNLDNITQNLIRIEIFRNQITEQSRVLKKFKIKKVEEVKKKVSFFGFETELFGALGKEKITRSKDSFYSKYLTNADIISLEQKIKNELEESSDQKVSVSEWKELQQLAKNYNNLEVDDKEETISKKNSIRSQLENKIGNLLVLSKKKNLEELGLDTNLFRMQTFLISNMDSTEEMEPSFDTKIFNESSPLAKMIDSQEMKESLKNAIRSIVEEPNRNISEQAESFNWKDLDIQILYSPLYKNPDSTLRAILFTKEDYLNDYKEFIDTDRDISSQLKNLHPKIRSRIQILKNRKNPTPPNLDKAFVELYKEYNELINKRDSAIESYLEKIPIPQDRYIAIESLRSLRDSAWEDSILLRYKPNTSFLKQYALDSAFREEYLNRWKELRKWVTDAKSELPPPNLKKMISDGIIGKSRSEAEELLWELDSTPLIPLNDKSLAFTILKRNITGIIRTYVDRTDGMNKIRENRNKAILTAIVIGMLSIFLAIFISGVVVQKIKRIIHRAEDVGKGNLGVVFEYGGNDEFGNLTIALNHMVQGLNEREKIKGILGSMIDPIVVSEAMKDLQALKRGSEKTITAFFSDIASFSSISEKLTSPELADLLNEYLSAMTIILKKYDGVLDKYIGDAIVGIFNSPIDVDDHAYKAVLTALDMQSKLIDLRKDWIKNNKYIEEARNMSFRIGLNTGTAKVGFMGTDALASYTMMGDTVNLAARLEAAGKDYGVHILASESIYKNVEGRIFARKLDVVRVKGKSQPVVLYEILNRIGEESNNLKEATHYYEIGLGNYLDRNWKEAIACFQRSIQIRGEEDKPSKMLIDRCNMYQSNPPPETWDGVYTRDTK